MREAVIEGVDLDDLVRVLEGCVMPQIGGWTGEEKALLGGRR